MMGFRSTLTPLKDFFACLVLRQWSKEDNPILGIQSIFHSVMGMARIFQRGAAGYTQVTYQIVYAYCFY